MIFVDSNVPMYLVGAEHPNKAAARRILERLTAADEPMVTSAEVFQEILHCYVALRRFDAIGPALDAVLGVVDVVHPIDLEDAQRARRLAVSAPALSARDSIHLAVMQRRGIDRILSFDTGFDGIVGITRITD